MSIQALAWLIEEVPNLYHDDEALSATQRLVLLSIANHADRFGGNAWPTMSTICHEAGVSKRRAQDAIRALEERGIISREVNEGGSRDCPADRRPNRYTILPLALADTNGVDEDGVAATITPTNGVDAPSPPLTNGVDVPSTPRGGRSVTNGVDAASTQTVLDPSNGTKRDVDSPDGEPGAPRTQAEQVAAIFEAWREATNHPRAVLAGKRKAVILARLKDGYTEAELIAAVQGIALSDFHMGQNDRAKKYDDITLALRDEAHVEDFANLAIKRRKTGGKSWMDRSTGERMPAGSTP
ncbi:MAG TPA: helix-turn-helix domain-containing protein [Acidimicrobiales bacterium]|nr:helix-turn-helix domain-containing protein [Acidimicrobiales bacterium]